MKKLLALLSLALLAACDGMTGSTTAQLCNDGSYPVSVKPMPTYVLGTCKSGQILTYAVPGNYSSGRGALNDPWFWFYIMGSSNYSHYRGYANFPHTTYISHRTIYANPRNFTAYSGRVSTTFRSSSRWSSSSWSGSRSSSNYSYRSSGSSYSFRRR